MHAFFANMGGFILTSSDYPDGFPIDAEQLFFPVNKFWRIGQGYPITTLELTTITLLFLMLGISNPSYRPQRCSVLGTTDYSRYSPNCENLGACAPDSWLYLANQIN